MLRRVLPVLLLAVLGASCSSGSGTGAPASTTTSTTTTTSTSLPTPTTTAPPAVFTGTVAPVTAADLGASWHPGCPVEPAGLRMVTVGIVGFDGVVRTGRVVVNADVADNVVEVFRRLFAARFPVRTMRPIFTQAEFEDFETPDDNSTGFSCRNAVNSNAAPSWSQHAFGHAIDINPIENPYLNGGRVIPSSGAAFTDRANIRPGMATSDSVLVSAFRSVGWTWGVGFRDYQHFSTNGR
jgi:D-alanyl-D-alanine carboxypeptidase